MMQQKRPLILLLTMWLAGCSILPGKNPPPTPPPEKVTSTSRQPPVKQKQELPLPAPPVYIIISRKLAPYTEVAEQLEKRLGKQARRYNLPTSKDEKQKLLQQIAAKKRSEVVTIGLDAALFTQSLTGHNQVFCQVFNYTEYGLTSARRKGVSMLPGVDKTLHTGKELSPAIHDVAVISGPGLDEVLQEAVVIAAKRGIVLHPVTVANDKEYLYTYKQMADKVQGYWLLPDNRVLSVRTLKDVMNFSVRNGKQVVTFSQDLLRLGGLFSVSSSYSDIADKVVQRLEQSAQRDEVPGADLLALDKVKLKINPVMVQRLGLSIPVSYRKYAADEKAY